MISTSDFKIGMKIAIDGEPYFIVDFSRSATGRGRANVRTKLKNIRTGQVLDKTFSSGESFAEPDFSHKKTQYLYNSGDEWFFMDAQTYDQFSLNKDQLGDYIWYLKENDEYTILYFEGNPINLDMPTSVILKVVEAEPAVKGDTVSNITKMVKLETGLTVKAPPFIKEGDRLKIDTRTGKYLERAN
ncbi:MAG: elongation factor P [candidate division Zixibacteria bacterium]|nr:elongation factor P [candidate division Zixibacteria bacterium]